MSPIKLIEGTIYLTGDGTGSRFYIRADGICQQFGANADRLAKTEGLLEEIAVLVQS